MDVREKLVELVKNALAAYGSKTNEVLEPFEFISDFLMANSVTVQRWVPVTERLPEKDGQYLCNYRFREYRGMTFTRVLDYYATDPVPHFQHTLGDTTMKVTHWMPLPKLPKEDEV